MLPVFVSAISSTDPKLPFPKVPTTVYSSSLTTCLEHSIQGEMVLACHLPTEAFLTLTEAEDIFQTELVIGSYAWWVGEI